MGPGGVCPTQQDLWDAVPGWRAECRPGAPACYRGWAREGGALGGRGLVVGGLVMGLVISGGGEGKREGVGLQGVD